MWQLHNYEGCLPNRYVTRCTSKVAGASYKFSIHSAMFHWKILVSAMRKGMTKPETSVTRWMLIQCFHWNKLRGIQKSICAWTSQKMDGPWEPWGSLLSCGRHFRKELQSKSWKSELRTLSLPWTSVWISGLITREWYTFQTGQVEKKQQKILWMLC